MDGKAVTSALLLHSVAPGSVQEGCSGRRSAEVAGASSVAGSCTGHTCSELEGHALSKVPRAKNCHCSGMPSAASNAALRRKSLTAKVLSKHEQR